ncbi:MAG: DUF1566 domain-containing protein [Betaproteobacteria bacterium]|nr:DUF1566 domain-containing protein [Betaproteobacteria bacterium]
MIWEVKTAENGLRDRSKTYTNYDDTNQNQKSTSGGYVKPTQADINAASNSIGFINAVNTVTLCGSAAWRMPSKDELLTLVRPSYSPMIDPAFFPNTPSEYFWSSTPYTDSAFAWVRPFGVGNSVGVDFRSEGSRYRVRLVRTGLPVSNFLLTVSAIGAGSGNITGGGINCASTAGATSGICSNNVVASDSTATLTASPYSGNTFSGWSGCPTFECATCVKGADAI